MDKSAHYAAGAVRMLKFGRRITAQAVTAGPVFAIFNAFQIDWFQIRYGVVR